MQRLMLFLSGGVVVLAVAVSVYLAIAPDKPKLTAPALLRADVSVIGGPFTLTDHTGAQVASAELIDRPTLMYFGYTYCPDVCPIDTANMIEAVEMLKAEGMAVQPVFITVDPERDTPASLKEWVDVMHPDLVGLTGSLDDIAAVAESFRVYYDKVSMPDSEAGYLMSHSAYMYLMMPDGLAAIIRNSMPPEEIARGVRQVLAAQG